MKENFREKKELQEKRAGTGGVSAQCGLNTARRNRIHDREGEILELQIWNLEWMNFQKFILTLFLSNLRI